MAMLPTHGGWKEEGIHLQNLPGASVYRKATAGAASVLTQMTAAGTGRRGAKWGSAQSSRPGENFGRWGGGTEGGLLGLTRICHLQGDFGFVQLVPSWLCGSQQHGAKQDKLGHILRASGDREDSAGQLALRACPGPGLQPQSLHLSCSAPSHRYHT